MRRPWRSPAVTTHRPSGLVLIGLLTARRSFTLALAAALWALLVNVAFGSAFGSVRMRMHRLWDRRPAASSISAPLPSFNAAVQVNFAQTPQIFPCSTSISGRFDSDCGGQCLGWADGGINCYDNTGAPVCTMTQPTGGLTLSNSYMLQSDGGWVAQWDFPDDTIATSHLAQCDSAAFRSIFATPHTFVYQGYMGSTGPDPTGWFAMITDGVNSMQLRRGGGNNLQMVETPGAGVASSGGDCLDNYCVIMGKREADGGFNVQQGGNKSTTVATTMANITGTNKLVLGGGIGGCCAPGGSQGGEFQVFTWYTAAKVDDFYAQNNKAAYGAQALASGNGTQVGNLAIRRARYDLDKPGGALPVFGVGDYLLDPLTGTITNQTYHVLGPVDSFDAGVLGGSAVVRAKTDKGPAFNWKHQNTAYWFTSEDGGIAWQELGSTTGDGGFILDTNAYFIGTAFTDGGYAVNNTYWIQNICTGGSIDGGFDHCTGTVAGNGVFAAYPRWGCPMVCSYATGPIKSILYVGNDAGQTGGLEVSLIQMTDTLEWEDPSVTNAQVSAQYLEVDAGAYISGGLDGGCNPGKICDVYLTQFSSSWYPIAVTEATPPGTGSYLYDISNPATSSTHDMLQWLSVESTPQTRDAGNPSVLDGLLYGNDPTYITPNKFAEASPPGQYNGAPLVSTAGVYSITCLSWDVETGILPDGGIGQGSRLIETADVCADQAHPYLCTDSTIVNQNTGQLGLCPGAPVVFEIGTRAGGSSPSTTRNHHMTFCSCSGPKCTGPCI